MHKNVAAASAVLMIYLFPLAGLAQGTGSSIADVNTASSTAIQVAPAVLKMTANVGSSFVLDGTRSIDDGVVGSYSWKQVSGPYVPLAAGAVISVTPVQAGTYVFELQMMDSTGLSSVAKIATVVVEPPQADMPTFEVTPVTPDTEIVSPPTAAVITTLPTKGVLYQTAPEAAAVVGGSVNDGNNENWDFGGSDTVRDSSVIDPDDDGDSVLTIDEDLRTSSAVVVKKVTVRGWDPEKKEEILSTAPTSAEEVMNEAGLEGYTARVMIGDERLESVAYEEEKVVVEYASHGRLFGFISIGFMQTVEVDSSADAARQGRVKVRLPWFSFLVAEDVPTRDIESAVSEGMEAGKGGDHKDWINLDSVSFQARIFSSISNVLKTKHDTAKNSVGNVR